jgi:hypothetical protein
MTDEELKIEALKIATNIGKLMNNVTTDDIVNIAETVAKFIKGSENNDEASLEFISDDDSTEENTADSEESFDTTEENTEENSEEKEENFEV